MQYDLDIIVYRFDMKRIYNAAGNDEISLSMTITNMIFGFYFVF